MPFEMQLPPIGTKLKLKPKLQAKWGTTFPDPIFLGVTTTRGNNLVMIQASNRVSNFTYTYDFWNCFEIYTKPTVDERINSIDLT